MNFPIYINQKYIVFHEKLHVLFGEQLNNENFLKWIVDKLGIRKSRFVDTVRRWEAIQYKESRGREDISFKSKQKIYNTWIENCITSTDGQNGRNVVQIRGNILKNMANFLMNQLDLKKTKISVVNCIILKIAWFWHAPWEPSRKSFTWKSTITLVIFHNLSYRKRNLFMSL